MYCEAKRCMFENIIKISESGEKYAVRLQSKTVQKGSKYMLVDSDGRGDGLFQWRKHYHGLCNIIARRLKLNTLMMDLILTNTLLFTSQNSNWWTGVTWIICGLWWCFYQLLGFSFWRHPFTAKDPLLSKLCNAKFLQMKKQTHLHLGCPEAEVEYIFSKFSFLGELFLQFAVDTEPKLFKCNLFI